MSESKLQDASKQKAVGHLEEEDEFEEFETEGTCWVTPLAAVNVGQLVNISGSLCS